MPIGNFPLEMWCGIKRSVNRIQDRYQDQLICNGPQHQPNDLAKLAGLGLRTLRYPILWERTAPDRLNDPDWRWADDRLNQLRALQIRPILGLVHHGCGPTYATFDTDAFALALPQYARQVAPIDCSSRKRLVAIGAGKVNGLTCISVCLLNQVSSFRKK